MNDNRCTYYDTQMVCGAPRSAHKFTSHDFTSTPATQPTPQPDGDWYVAGESSSEATIRTRAVTAPGDWVGQVKREHAAQIVADHNAVPKLIAAILDESLPRPDGPCWCDDAYTKDCHVERCLSIRAALAAASGNRAKENR